MSYNSKYTGQQVEALLDIVSQGGSSGGEGGTITEAELLAMGFTKNIGTITEVKMNGASKGTSGVVDLGTVITEHQDISGKQDKIADLDTIREGASKGATALQSIPSEYVTESELTAKGYAKESALASKQDVIADLSDIRSGASKGATALQSIPSEYITETELTSKGYATTSALNNKVDKVSGKGLSTEDFTSALKTKLEGLSNYDDATISNALSQLRTDFDTLVSGDTTDAIKSFNEIVAFLDGIEDSQDLSSIIASIEQQIGGKQDVISDLATIRSNASKVSSKQDTISDLATIRSGASLGATALQSIPSEYVTQTELTAKGYATTSQLNGKQDTISDLATIRSGAGKGATAVQPSSLASVATSGSYNDLSNKPTIPSAVTESTVSGWGFTKNSGTYSKPSTGIPKTDLASAVQTSLNNADTAYQKPSTGIPVTDFKESVRTELTRIGEVTNGYSGLNAISTTIGNKQDKLVSGTSIKTINGESLLGSGNIAISGGGGETLTEADISAMGFTKNVGTITAIQANGTAVASSGTANIPAASTSKYGVTKLSSATNSTSTALAATASAVKSAYDLANGKQDKLVSGTNIKTINGQSLLGSGNITIEGGTGGSSSGESKEIVSTHNSVIESLEPNKIYIATPLSGQLTIESIEFPTEAYAEYSVIICLDIMSTENMSLVLPSDVMWANGMLPDTTKYATYELSIVYWNGGGANGFNAVLTPFDFV